MTEEVKEANRKIDEMDRMTLEIAKQRRLSAIMAAENADLVHKNAVLQLYMKYNLSPNDSIKEDSGEIIKDGALQIAAPAAGN